MQNNKGKRKNNTAVAANRTEENLTNRIIKFSNVISNESVYGIPLLYKVENGLINYSVKFDIKIICTFETNIKNCLNQTNK